MQTERSPHQETDLERGEGDRSREEGEGAVICPGQSQEQSWELPPPRAELEAGHYPRAACRLYSQIHAMRRSISLLELKKPAPVPGLFQDVVAPFQRAWDRPCSLLKFQLEKEINDSWVGLSETLVP